MPLVYCLAIAYAKASTKYNEMYQCILCEFIFIFGDPTFRRLSTLILLGHVFV